MRFYFYPYWISEHNSIFVKNSKFIIILFYDFKLKITKKSSDSKITAKSLHTLKCFLDETL